MFPSRQSAAAAATASWLIAGIVFRSPVLRRGSQAQAPAGRCEDAAELAVLPSPIAPWKGAPLRVHFRRGEAARGRAVADRARWQRRGQIARAARRTAVFLVRRGRVAGRRDVASAARARPRAGRVQHDHARDRRARREPPRPTATQGSVWPVRNAWNRATENLYSAWIEKLFDAPLDAAPSWKALHEVLRDRSRNVLFNHLGLREDEIGALRFAPTAPTCRTSCARISRSRWACRSATRSARAAAAAAAEVPRRGGTSRTRSRVPLRLSRVAASAPRSRCFARPARPADQRRSPPGPWRSRRGLRRGRRGWRRGSAITCATPSPTGSIPDPGGRPRTTTTPTTIRCR